ncbi:MAG: homoserine kinase [Chloroflexi bacterium]|nr:homoserine kinase [Chloroflexota bacterium]
MTSELLVQIPATTANLGPGFDALGLALELFNTVSVERADALSVAVEGEGAGHLPLNAGNLVYRAIAAYYKLIDAQPPPLRVRCRNSIPLARGLGSSAAAIVGGLVAANALEGNPLSDQALLGLAHRLEGHPDNVAASLHGGLTVALLNGEDVVCLKVLPPANLHAVLFIPDFAMSTEAARRVVPRQISRADAVFNIGRAAAVVASLATGQSQYLSLATQDRLHQPYRQTIFPAMSDLFAAALEAGAAGAFLSGAGSTICALAVDREAQIAEALAATAARLQVRGRSLIASVSQTGARTL